MTTSFELLLLQEKIQDPEGVRTQVAFETLPEADQFLDNLLEPYQRNSFSLFVDLNDGFRRRGFWPWAIVLMDREYRLAGHVFITRDRLSDVIFSGYSIRSGYLVEKNGPPSMSMLFFRNKAVASALAQKSPLFSVCWSVLQDKSESKHWLCQTGPLPQPWVQETEKGDDVLFSLIYSSWLKGKT